MTQVAQVGSKEGAGIALHFGLDQAARTAPFAVNAETGYACLKGSLGTASWEAPERREVLALADQMRASDEGLWLAMVDFPGEKRLCLIQTNRGRFYEAHYGVHHHHSDRDHHSERGWRDFYSRVGYYLVDHASGTWEEPELVVGHVTGFGWPREVTVAFLDGVRSWSALNPDAVLTEMYFQDGGGCGMRSTAQILDALKVLDEYDAGWVNVDVVKGPPRDFGFETPALDAYVTMYKIDVETQVE